MEPLTYLWKDRKRILGMPISFTKYALTGPYFYGNGPVEPVQ